MAEFVHPCSKEEEMKPSDLKPVLRACNDNGEFKFENLYTESQVADAIEAAMDAENDLRLAVEGWPLVDAAEWRDKIIKLRAGI